MSPLPMRVLAAWKRIALRVRRAQRRPRPLRTSEPHVIDLKKSLAGVNGYEKCL